MVKEKILRFRKHPTSKELKNSVNILNNAGYFVDVEEIELPGDDYEQNKNFIKSIEEGEKEREKLHRFESVEDLMNDLMS